MDKLAFLFPGQGSQFVGMGRDLAETYPVAEAVFREADQALGFSLSDVLWNGPAEHLAETAITQPAILTVSVAIAQVLQEFAVLPMAAAGLSLGEYGALVSAESLSLSDALRLVHQRGRLMQEAVPLGLGAVAVVIGLDAERIERACAAATLGMVSIANYNCPEQVAIAGETQAVDEVMQKCRELGAKRVLRLPVSAPFHTPMLRGAGESFRPYLEKAGLKTPKIPVANNVTAEYYTGETLVPLLVQQVSSPVRFESCVRRLLQDGFTHFVELGPGTTLGGFLKRIDRNATVYSADNAAGLKRVLEVLG